MATKLIVPPTIEAVIRKFEQQKEPFAELTVQQELGKARGELQNPTDEENLGAWAEVLAFGLVPGRTHQSRGGRTLHQLLQAPRARASRSIRLTLPVLRLQ